MSDLRLGIDTAGAHLALALSDEKGTVLAARAPRVEREHAALIVPELDALFLAASRQRHDVASVHVGLGPGSYTGLRVGLAAAQGLATAWGVPLLGGCSLATLAWGTLKEGETGVAWLDARRGNVYAAAFLRTAETLEVLTEPAKRSRDELLQTWPAETWLDDAAPNASWLTAHAIRSDALEPRYW